MKKKSPVIPILLIAAAVIFLITRPHPDKHRAISGLKDPVQKETTGGVKKSLDGYDLTIDFKYTYDIEALVISTKDYSPSNIGNKLSPKDLALAWGPVAQVNDKYDFHWRHGSRFYYWNLDSWDDLERIGGESVVTEHSANCHIIPADDEVKKKVKKMKAGDHIRLKGYLVNIDGSTSDGNTFWWYSSTVRSDSGDGACEVIYVTDAQILP